MHALIEGVRSALSSIKAHGFRSFLTTLGIVIGVASVIAVVSVVQGLNHSINQQFEGLGSNSLSVMADVKHEDYLKGKIARITDKDYREISEKINFVDSITPLLYAQGNRTSSLQFKSKETFGQVIGTTFSYQTVYSSYINDGRFLSFNDNKSRRRVVVIGPSVIEKLNLPNKPVGEYIQIGGEWFKIIGVTEPRGKLLGFDQDNFALIPFSTMQSLNGLQIQPDIAIQLTLSDVSKMSVVKARIKHILRKNHNLKPLDQDDFKIQTPEQLTKTFTSIIDSITYVLGGIVSISLLVGGIGIMNIMLVSVTERTREIGICKAIGAKRHHILLQFLIEAISLSVLGGIVGILLGYGLGALAALSIPSFPPATVPFWAIGIAFGFSTLVGIVFGIVPAAKAANLKPIDALRYE